MLVLSRKVGESIVVHMADGRTVDVTVTDIVTRHSGTSRVKVGVSAPSDVLVMRAELEIRAEEEE